MAIISAIIIGLIVGATAKFFIPGKYAGGWIITILLGMAASFMAHSVGACLGWYADGEPAGYIASIIGAVILLEALQTSLDGEASADLALTSLARSSTKPRPRRINSLHSRHES